MLAAAPGAEDELTEGVDVAGVLPAAVEVGVLGDLGDGGEGAQVVVALVGVYGTAALAAFGVTNRLMMFATVPCYGLGSAAGTLVGQNLGAKKPQRAETTGWWSIAYGAVYLILITSLTIADIFN